MKDTPDEMIRGYSPRNPWTRLRTALALAEAGDPQGARALIEGVRYHAEISTGILDLYLRLLPAETPPVINGPADYLGDETGLLRPPFRRLTPGGKPPPRPYPPGMALPRLVGARNDSAFLGDAATALADAPPRDITRVAVALAGPLERLPQGLDAQDFEGRIALTLFGAPEAGSQGALTRVTAPLLSPEGAAHLQKLAQDSDLVILLDAGARALDPLFVARAARLARVSDVVVQPLVPAATGDGAGLRSVFTGPAEGHALERRYPFRELCGLNMAVPARLLRREGGPDARFDCPARAASELAFRLITRAGAYLAPLPVPAIAPRDAAPGDSPCGRLYRALCPNSWDNRGVGPFEVPRISVYIPAYNASKYLARAIDSVLEQDVADLEVCVADDGSVDTTPQLLAERYGNEPRVRWESGRNGGIGHASNRAIGLSRAPYIGQLDSDDCLKPGAVRRLAEYLDEHPEVACAYGSCERIDAQGGYLQDEYSWPEFSREKMMITSIAHHFRMFRRANWERAGRFREDIVNAVDYDIFLKLAETGRFHHIDEVLYQRRWHGENTSNVNEGFQTTNTYRVQTEALRRQGLARFWEVRVPDPKEPRRVGYRRRAGRRMTLFWPDYSHSNPYQKLLYQEAARDTEIVAGPIEAALELIARGEVAGPDLTFHLHWLNALFRGLEDAVEARLRIEDFLAKVAELRAAGARVVWTLHNTVSHDAPFRALEVELSHRLAAGADLLHVHSAASVPEIEAHFPLPADRVAISRHGHYIGAYPDMVTRAQARACLGLEDNDEVILFSGQVRPYKGVEDLISVTRKLLADRPRALLLVAGQVRFDLLGAVQPALSPAEAARIRMTDRFVGDDELQLFFRAADFAVYPYRHILTSGSLLLALSFGLPCVVPAVGMTRELMEDAERNCAAGALYDSAGGAGALEAAMRAMLAHKDAGRLPDMARAARALAETQSWPDATPLLAGKAARET